MKDKEFIDHFSGLKASSDGEFFVPKSGTHPEHYTYGYKMSDGHRAVRYKGKWHFVHRMVAECFLNGGEPIDGKVYAVHHINGVKDDNRASNLLIITHEEHKRLHMEGKSLNEETKKKISEAKKGKHRSKETKQKISETLKKPIIGVHNVSGEAMEFESAKDAAIALNIYAANITACCKGKLKSTGGWRFEYKIA